MGQRALECAWRIRDNAEQQSLGVRIGVHVGEVELTTHAARGIAVHEVARITVSR
jgi:class 3 adenylate cyclase